MTNTEIKIRLEKILVRNEQRKANKLIPSDILDLKDLIKQLSICDVVGRSEQLKTFNCINALDGYELCKEQCLYCKNVKGF